MNGNIKKIILLFIILTLSILTFGKFNNDKSVSCVNVSKEQTEITFVSSWGGDDTKARELQKAIDYFHLKNPDIKIINRSRGNDDFLFTLKTDFAQGNDPDVFGLWPGSDIKNLIKTGKVADLTDILNKDTKWKESFNEKTFRYDTVNGLVYGLPVEIIYEALFINRDLFKKYNVKVPETYEDLLNAVAAFKKHNIIPIAYNTSPEGTYIYQNIVAKLGGKEGVEEPYSGFKINDCYINAMYYMRDLYNRGAFPKNAFTLDDKSRNNLFLEKKAAMIVQGSWFIGNGSLDPKDSSIDIVPFPTFKEEKSDTTSIIYGLGNGNFCISSSAFNDSKKKAACIKFLKFLTSKDTTRKIVNVTGSISSIKNSEIIEDSSNVLSIKGRNLMSNSKELIGPPDSFLKRSSWENILVKRFPEMLDGNIKPEDIFNEMDK